ncbi:hypothetical protein [Nitrosococcus wardiae]|nr:hypothetical protein [Nitrosococcus wardiae]
MLRRRILYAVLLLCIPLSGLILSCGVDFESGRSEYTIRYSRIGPLAKFNIPSSARAYGSDGYLLAEAKAMDGMEIPEEGIPSQIVLLETQYAGGRAGKKVVYEGKLIFDAQTGQLLREQPLQGKKRFENVFPDWPFITQP